MMAKKALTTVLQDALISISDEDSRESRELLLAAGIDSDAVVQASLAKIEQLKHASQAKLAKSQTNTDPFQRLNAKVRTFLSHSPERATNFLNSYFQEHALPVSFAATTGLNRQKFEKIKDKIDLNDLSSKLDDEAKG